MPTPVLVNPNGATDPTPSANISNSQNTYHFHTSSLVRWCFGAKQTGGFYRARAFKSIDDGATWTEKDAGNGPVGNFPGIFWDGADTVYIGTRSADTFLHLYSFDLVAETFGAQIGPSSGALAVAGSRWIIRFSDTTFRLFYTEGGSLKFQDFDGAAWTNTTTIGAGTSAEIQMQADIQHIIRQEVSDWKYTRVARDGSISGAYTFPSGDGISLFGGTIADGVYESDNDEIVFPAIVVIAGTIKVVVYRGTPTSAPTWTQELVYTETDFDDPTFPTLVRLANGTEQIFFVYYPVSPNQDDGFNSLSAIATATNSGSGWSSISQYYNLAIDPFSNPAVGEGVGDEIVNIGVDVVDDTPYVNFDGFSGNFTPHGQTNVALIPTCIPEPITIPTSPQGYDFSLATYPHQRPGFEYNGSQYLFLHAGGVDATPAGDGKTHAFKSTDNGGTWLEKDSANARDMQPSSGGDPGFNIQYTVARDGAKVLILATIVQAAFPNPVIELRVFTFNLSTDTWGPTTNFGSPLPGPVNINSSAGDITAVYMRLIVRGANDYILYYSGASDTSGGTLYARLWYVTFNGTTFGTPVKLPDQGGPVAYVGVGGEVDSSGICHLFYANTDFSGTVSLYHVGLDSSLSFGTSQPLPDSLQYWAATSLPLQASSTSHPVIYTPEGGNETVAIVTERFKPSNHALQQEVLYYAEAILNPIWLSSIIVEGSDNTTAGGDARVSDVATFPVVQGIGLIGGVVSLSVSNKVIVVSWAFTSIDNDCGFYYTKSASDVLSWANPFRLFTGGPITGGSTETLGLQIWSFPMSIGVGILGVTVDLNSSAPSFSAEIAQFDLVCIEGAPPIPAPTCSLSGSPLTITLGDSSTLSWTTTGPPDTATIDNGVGSVDPSGGSVVVSPTETTTYILTVTNGSGSSTCQVTITVIIPPPPVSACDSIVTDFFRYQLLYDRWLPGQLTKIPGSLEDMIYEPDTGELMLATFGPVEIGDQDDDRDTLFSYVDKDGTLGTSDDWLGDDGIDGTPISTRFKTGFFYLDSPALDKLLQDIILEIDNPIGITCLVYYDYSDTPDPSDTFVIPGSTDGRRRISLLSQVLAGFSEGKEFYSVAFEFCWTGVKRVTLYGLTFHYEPLALAQTGMIAVWDKGTADWDKKVYECTIEYTNYGFPDLVASLDTMSGIDSLTQNLGVATFPLPETTPGARARVVFPVYGDVVYKLRRLSLFNGDSNIIPIFEAGKIIRIYDVKYQEEALPPDIVPSTPWNDFGSPWDKVPRSLMISADTGGFSVPVTLQNEYGNVVTVNHTGTFVSRPQDYAVPPDNFGKLWRLVALPPAGGKFEMDKWDIDKILDPPTHIVFTDWSDQDWVAEKIARNLHLTVDTGGIQAQVQLMADGTVKETFLITTTYQDRRRNLNCASDLLGKMWRLLWVPGINGRVKLWNWLLEGIKEPVPTTLWDSYEQAFGYQGWKAWKLMSFMYISPSTVNITIYRENKEIFFSVSLPAHAHRDIEQILLPSAVSTSLNKSRTYRIVVTSDQPCKFYLDASRIEFLAIGAARHQVLQQKALSEILETTAM